MNVQSVNNKTRAPRPPEKGCATMPSRSLTHRSAFPLDHFGDCEEPKLRYQQCLDSNSLTSRHCRDIAKEYLTCRMDRYARTLVVRRSRLGED